MRAGITVPTANVRLAPSASMIFGLIHGLGFASALTELDLARDALVRALIGFNVGVESSWARSPS
jgi:HupE / UreJ protein